MSAAGLSLPRMAEVVPDDVVAFVKKRLGPGPSTCGSPVCRACRYHLGFSLACAARSAEASSVIRDYSTNDTFVFTDVPSTAIGFVANSQDLIFAGPGWTVTFYAHWFPVSYATLERVEFSDGAVWNQAQIEAAYQQATQP